MAGMPIQDPELTSASAPTWITETGFQSAQLSRSMSGPRLDGLKGIALCRPNVEMTMRLPPLPSRPSSMGIPEAGDFDIDGEANRLMERIGQRLRWTYEACKTIAPLTLRINQLKQEEDVIIIAHTYQTPDIVYGVADAVGDSYTLSKIARDAPQSTILFSSVRFMAETAKILSPQKRVIHPSPEAGCSLSEGISASDVRALKSIYPNAPVACYINTTAAVKAECDVCVTSSNYLTIAENLPGDEIIFVPDRLMGLHLKKHLEGKKTVHLHDADCEVHAAFSSTSIQRQRKEANRRGLELKVLAHPECDSDVLEASDFVGSSERILVEAKRLGAQDGVAVMMITECGTAERAIAESNAPIELMGSCSMCRHMKRTHLEDILQAIESPAGDQIVEIEDSIIERARLSLDQMFKLSET
ncbi:MAG: quinolinate synthase [Euryarchaeota archaeon]|nr:quinolinate synthase [Euryarchaeota archaeon]NDB93661.1 quinolinate synthase [Euryarchaeota archaeon]NDF22656.1 quinolinate synthase [Euryarchaeota archaeon]NDF36489.1 quinolinate synthase [Euryarchaeota archaeon]NDG21353.1 quinolinate synthase [Euryarchaeota archaeon]